MAANDSQHEPIGGSMDTPRLFTRVQAAKYLGVSEETFRGMVEKEVIPRVLLYPGARPRYDRHDIEKLIVDAKEGS